MNALDKRLSVALEASAGTGKTFQLSMRVAGMLMDGVPPRDILCLTFTKKAADEMLERIVSIIDSIASGKASQSDVEAILPLMKSYSAGKNKDFDEKSLEKIAAAARERLLAEFSSLQVKTIDAFSNNILKLFPFEAELRPDYKICPEEDEGALLEEAFYSMTEELLEEPAWKRVMDKAAKALEIHPTRIVETLLKYAAFGATRRIELNDAMTRKAPGPEEIEALIEKALEERKKAADKTRRFAGFFEGKTLAPRQENIRSKLARAETVKDILGSKKMFTGGPSDHIYFKKYDFPEEQEALGREVRETVGRYLTLKGEIAKALCLSLGKLLYARSRRLKSDKNILTYSDIGQRAFEMLVTDKPHIDREYLYFRLDGRINHILVDEFQDTSAAQWLILKPLAEEAMAGLGQKDREGSFFYVGDPKQNLYRFRGGSSGLFRNVATKYGDRLEKLSLNVNYRSDRHIVETVNEIFNAAWNMFPKESLSFFKINQEAAPGREEGYAEIDYLPKGEDFALYAVKKIKEAKDAGWDYGEIAVLVPANKDGAIVKEALRAADIPVRLETSRKLTDTGAFRALLALADFIETEYCFSFLEYSLIEHFAFTPTKYADNGFREAVKKNVAKIAASSPYACIFEKILAVVKESGMQERFSKEPDFIQTLDIMAAAAPNEKNIVRFREAVKKEAAEKQSVTAEENRAVTVMTIHKSKGLQFPLVILPKLDIKLESEATGDPFVLIEGKAPGQSSLEFVHIKETRGFLDEKQFEAMESENDLVLQDALNKLYVAFTRSKNAVIAAVEEPGEKEDEPKNVSKLLPRLINVPLKKGVLKRQSQPAPGKEPNARLKTIRVKMSPLSDKSVFKSEKTVSFAASAFGTVFHSAAFFLEGFDEKAADEALTKALVKEGAYLKREEIEELRLYLRILAASPAWKELFDGKVFRERKIGADGGLYSIDIYSLMENKILLADYKTGEITKEKVSEYMEQLNRYAALLNKTYDLPVEKKLFHFHKRKLDILNYSLD